MSCSAPSGISDLVVGTGHSMATSPTYESFPYKAPGCSGLCIIDIDRSRYALFLYTPPPKEHDKAGHQVC